MEVGQLELWARWLALQRDRVIAVMELEEVEKHRRCISRRRRQRGSKSGCGNGLHGHYCMGSMSICCTSSTEKIVMDIETSSE